MDKHLLLGCKGCGNVIVESAFALAGIPLDTEEVDYSAGSPTRGRLLEVNPLGQVPTLVLPDGSVMTESLAMIHYVDDLAPQARLVPRAGTARHCSPTSDHNQENVRLWRQGPCPIFDGGSRK